MDQPPVVLYVDDEKANLDSFQLSFMGNFTIHLAQTGEEALKLLELHPIEVLLTDQKMPGMTGIELLEKVHLQYPDVISILITGYGDMELTSQAINKGKIYYFFEKPWDEELLLKAIHNASEKYSLRKENQKLIQNLKESNQQLRLKIEELDTIIYRASHDINGSLARILGLCNLAFQEALPSNYFHLINKETSVLTQTLYNIMDMHELQDYEFKPEKTDLNSLITELTERVSKVFGITDTQFTINSFGNIEVNTDPELLKRAFLPVIQNAFLHAGENPNVSITINQEGDRHCITVADKGKGIEESFLHRVTEKFFRGNNLSPGNGLGLYISKMAIENLGGSLKIDSDRRGTKVKLFFPSAY